MASKQAKASRPEKTSKLAKGTTAGARSKASRGAAPATHVKAPATGPELVKARALLRAVKQDPVRRRYKHEWEKAIRALERAASGHDRAPALLDAARARYALYRFSSDEADRDRALSLARKASAAGARDAATFIQAVRREAGDEDPAHHAPAPRPRERAAIARKVTPTAPAGKASATHERDEAQPRSPDTSSPQSLASGSPAAGHGEVADEPPDTDPVLDRILAQLAEDPSEDSGHASGANGPVAVPPPAAAPSTSEDDALARAIGGLRGGVAPSPPMPPAPAPAPAPAAAPAPAPALALHDRFGDVSPLRAAEDDSRSGPIRKIVIDPGHGGHDPGAIGPTRVREKDVVLAIARRLARKLEQEGFEAVLTRDDDRYLALAERTALANAHEGDLFVSIHANAHPRRNREGVETWVLDVSSDRYASRLAARENGIVDDADSPMDVRRILADLDAKVSAQASRRLARVVQQEMTSGIRGRFGDVRDLGVKSALFYVLLGARMPAVLVETSFISNRAEEKRLASPRFQEEVASALTRAINSFAAQQARIAAR